MATQSKPAATASNGSSSKTKAKPAASIAPDHPKQLKFPIVSNLGPINPAIQESPKALIVKLEEVLPLISASDTCPNDNHPYGYRNKSQITELKEFLDAKKYQIKTVDGATAGFPDNLDWAYRGYSIQPDSIQKTSSGERQFQQNLYLFNVIVSLEWKPSERYMRMLQRAFRRASDFLYDVTDGYMAFGQVVFGGMELMSCADIQIMASNRLLPRSWVGGLHRCDKFMPIRIGRGLWQKTNRVSIDWDQPEGYRTLIHEWAHYALELLDDYLETHDVFQPGDIEMPATSNPMLIRANRRVVVPKISLPIDSIMSTLEGTSELVPKNDSGEDRKSKEWERIIEKGRFPYINQNNENQKHDPIEIPLPIPNLPVFGKIISIEQGEDQSTPTTGDSANGDELMLYEFPANIQPEHTWVYILSAPRSDSEPDPRYILAQGTLDARALSDGFRLLGARDKDTIVMIGSAGEQTTVLSGTVKAIPPTRPSSKDTTLEASITWNKPQIGDLPIIDVVPKETDGTRTPATIEFHISPPPVQAPANDQLARLDYDRFDEKQVIAFAMGCPSESINPNKEPAALDGHVLVRWGDPSNIAISTFSQGGGPPTNSPGGPPPITAGSSEGNIMLFFEDKGLRPDYQRVRVVTNRLYGTTYRLPGGAQARSYAFSVASTAPLPQELSPTLVMYYDKTSSNVDGDPVVHRLDEKTGQWTPIPSYMPAGAWYVAVPLNEKTARRIVALDAEGPRVEQYRLYWVPRKKGANAAAEQQLYPL